jgi:methyltransferase family protein
MDRIAIAQSLLDATEGANYLEIGVCTGSSFIPIRASKKWGVDPGHLVSRKRRAKYAAWAWLRIKNERLFRMTSDEFFTAHTRMLAAHGIDVCLVDGLHTYEQSYRDLLNALAHLRPNGVILVHDCNPSTETAACPATSIDEVAARYGAIWNGAWSGDVWKTIVRLRSCHHDLKAFVLDCDTGVGVVTRGRPRALLPYSESEIRAMDYEFLASRREELLGLQPPAYFRAFLNDRLHSLRT